MKKILLFLALIIAVSFVTVSCKEKKKETLKEKIASGDKKSCCEESKKECSKKEVEEGKACKPNCDKPCCKDKKEKSCSSKSNDKK